MKKYKWRIFVIIGSLALMHSAALLAARDNTPIVIHHTTVEKTNGGINPEYFGYKITGFVTWGHNDCEADQRVLRLHESVQDRVLYLVAKSERAPTESINCPEVFDPVYVAITKDIRYSAKDIEKIVIINTGTNGGTQTIIP
jgi:hypothetical protein